MQILARGAYMGVPKLSSDGSQVEPFFEQFGRSGMPEPMTVAATLDSSLLAKLLNLVPKMARFELVSQCLFVGGTEEGIVPIQTNRLSAFLPNP